MDIDHRDTALVITDPQNDFLSPDGATWGLVGNSVTENDTVAHIEDLIGAAKSGGIGVFVSPHYHYPTDSAWQFGGAVENLMHEIDMFARRDALSLEGFDGSGADWLERYKPLIADGETVITSPHKVYGPASNDLRFSFGSAASTRPCWPACRPTSASRHTSGSCSRTASRWSW